jgi:hypothetical protein
MTRSRPAIFRGRHFEPEIIATCVRWYLRFSLSLRNVEEMMAERGLMVDHTTVWRWCQKYGPMIYQRLRGKLKYTTTTWHMDDTYVRLAGRWVYLFRAVDDTEGPIAGFPENESRNDIDCLCSLIEDCLIGSHCLKHFSSSLIPFATLPLSWHLVRSLCPRSSGAGDCGDAPADCRVERRSRTGRW